MQQGDNAKTIAGGLMARTDFARSFGLLPGPRAGTLPRAPGPIRRPGPGCGGPQGNRNEKLFGAPVARGLANDRTETTILLTRGKWLREPAAPGHDLLKNTQSLTEQEQETVADAPGALAVHKSLGALGDEDNRVTVKKEEIQLMVAELRRMKDGVPAEKLKPLAVAAFKLIDQLNQGKKLSYGKRED